MRILPSGPDPITSEILIPFYPAIFLANGLAKTLPVEEFETLVAVIGWLSEAFTCYWAWIGLDCCETFSNEKFFNLSTSSDFFANTATV